MTSSTLIVTEAPHRIDFDVFHGEDWYEPWQQLVDPVSGDPWDVTDVTIELFARPSFDHATRFVLLTSVASAGILKESAAEGLVAIFYSQANVEANLPLSPSPGWDAFIRLSFTDPALGAVKKLLSRGALNVLPAKDDPSA